MRTPIPRLLRAFTALSIAGLAPALATAQTTLTTFFGDSGSTAFGQQGVWDTEVVRSGTASWRVTYPDQWSIHAIQATESSTLASSLAPYAGAGWFELYYRSSMDGTIRFIPLTGGHQPMMDPVDLPIVATDEWTRLEIPFNGWNPEPASTEVVRFFTIRGWGGGMSGAVVHYDDLSFVIPASEGQAQVDYATTPILVDGIVEDGYGDQTNLLLTPAADAELPDPGDLAVSWRAAFDADNLYLAIEYVDDVLVNELPDSWTNDSVEIFLDGNNSKGADSDDNDLKLAFVPKAGGEVDIITDVFPPNPAGTDFSGVQAAHQLIGSGDYEGFLLEVKIPLTLLGITAEEGWAFGIDYQINDNDTPEDGRDHLLTWYGTSLNNNVAGYGTATLGAVPDQIAVTGVTVEPEELQLATGGNGQLTAAVSPSNATSAGVTWSSSDEAVATVGPNGSVAAVGAGSATITVTTDDGAFTDTAEVTVVEAEPFTSIVDATETGAEGWWLSDWFGLFYTVPEFNGWIWHEGLGWTYIGDIFGSDHMWIWVSDLNTWVYTNEDIFGYAYLNGETWIYYTMSEGRGYQYDFGMESWYRIEPLTHPYLYFTADDIPAIRERMDHPAFATRRARLMTKADSLLAANPSSDSRSNQGNSGLLAFAYIVTGEEKYAERAIEEALASAAVTSWIANHSFNRGADLQSSERTLGAAMVYDWCYDVMTEQERATIREAMLNKGLTAYLSTIDPNLSENWWTYHPINNWRGVGHGGNAVGGLALYYESALARQAARAANEHVPLALQDHILMDSGGHEGNGYNNYGVEYALLGITALHRFYGGHEDLMRELADDRLGAYWDVYLHAPDYMIANFGRHPNWNSGLFGQTGAIEGGPSSIRSGLFDSLVPGGDELLRWSADNGGQRFYWEAASPFLFLWRREAPSLYGEDRPALQDVVLFRGAGHAVWQSPELYFAMNGGGAAHNRGDLGAFVLVAGTERLIHLEPSLNFLGSEYQSTILVNGAGQSNGGPPPYGEYLRFGSGDGFHYLATRIDAFYSGLTRAVRHAVMVRGKYIVLLDDLTAPASATLEARFQSSRDVELGAGAAKVLGNQHDLHILTEGFDEFTFGQGSGGALKFISLKRDAQEAVLLTILYPVAKGGAAPTVQVDGGTVTITDGDVTDELVFTEEAVGWFLSEVNGADATGLTDFVERNIVPYRDGLDDSGVPSWLLEVIR